jgi:hypothetical protein
MSTGDSSGQYWTLNREGEGPTVSDSILWYNRFLLLTLILFVIVYILYVCGTVGPTQNRQNGHSFIPTITF